MQETTNAMEKLHPLLNFFIKYHRVLGMGFLAASGESIFSSVVFQCPCSTTWNLPYSLVFFLVPALVLFLLGYLLNSEARQVVTDCCAGNKGDPFGTTCCKADPGPCGRIVKCCPLLIFSKITLAAAVAPITWIVVALFWGSYYECVVSGSLWAQKRLCQEQKPNCSVDVLHIPCQKTNSEEVQQFLRELKAQSQVAGWTVIAVIMALFMVVKFYNCCTSPVSFLHLKFLKIYKKKEKKILKTESKRYATDLAKRNIKCFFENVQLDNVRIPSDDEWKEISAVLQTNATYYSSLHKYANNRPVKEAAHQNPFSN